MFVVFFLSLWPSQLLSVLGGWEKGDCWILSWKRIVKGLLYLSTTCAGKDKEKQDYEGSFQQNSLPFTFKIWSISCWFTSWRNPLPPKKRENFFLLSLLVEGIIIGPFYMFLDYPSSSFPCYLPPHSPLVIVSLFFISVSLIILCLLVCFAD